MRDTNLGDASEGGVVRLNWGCGSHVMPGWINSDVKRAPEIDLVADIKRGLPLAGDSVDYAVSVHALPELRYDEIVPALGELRRVLKPGGVLRLVLPDLDKAIRAYVAGDHGYFDLVADDAETLGGRLVTQILWYGYSRTLFTEDFAEELLERAGFQDVARCEAHRTASRHSEIVELDNREKESLYMEATKPERGDEIEGASAPEPSSTRGYSPAIASGQLEVIEVANVGSEADNLKACRLDMPTAGSRVDGRALRVVGWVVGGESPAKEVEVVSDHTVVARAPVEVQRPGVAKSFAGVAGADAAGFDITLAPKGRGIRELLVTAVLENGTRAAIGTIRVNVPRRRGLLARFLQ
jgi:predicted SAM-dependent methyltransferase